MAEGSAPSGAAFLLSQLGAAAARRFAERLAPLGLLPAHVGVLRLVAQQPGLSQQALAAALGVAPSRVVALVDDLEQRGLLRRARSAEDRRNYELHIADAAQPVLADVRAVVRRHDSDMIAPLTKDERIELVRLLAKLADAAGVSALPTPAATRRSR